MVDAAKVHDAAEAERIHSEAEGNRAEAHKAFQDSFAQINETMRINIELMHAINEVRKSEQERQYYPLVVFAAAVASTVALFGAAFGVLRFLG